VTDAHVAGIVEVASWASPFKATADPGDEHAGLGLQLGALGSRQGRTELLLRSAGRTGAHLVGDDPVIHMRVKGARKLETTY
jgi:hypothetical protein